MKCSIVREVERLTDNPDGSDRFEQAVVFIEADVTYDHDLAEYSLSKPVVTTPGWDWGDLSSHVQGVIEDELVDEFDRRMASTRQTAPAILQAAQRAIDSALCEDDDWAEKLVDQIAAALEERKKRAS